MLITVNLNGMGSFWKKVGTVMKQRRHEKKTHNAAYGIVPMRSSLFHNESQRSRLLPRPNDTIQALLKGKGDLKIGTNHRRM